MNIIINENSGVSIAELVSSEIEIKSSQDAVDLLGNAGYQGAEKVIIHEHNLSPEFFDLKTGLAGEVLQKFSNYNMQLAIVGEYSKFTSKALRDFIFESNRQRRINFVTSVEEAREVLTTL